MEDEVGNKGKAERMQLKKVRSKLRIHGGSLRIICQNVIRSRLREKK